ncbi:hypothetical protein ACJX0J_030775, partial [Zea mays]
YAGRLASAAGAKNQLDPGSVSFLAIINKDIKILCLLGATNTLFSLLVLVKSPKLYLVWLPLKQNFNSIFHEKQTDEGPNNFMFIASHNEAFIKSNGESLHFMTKYLEATECAYELQFRIRRMSFPPFNPKVVNAWRIYNCILNLYTFKLMYMSEVKIFMQSFGLT